MKKTFKTDDNLFEVTFFNYLRYFFTKKIKINLTSHNFKENHTKLILSNHYDIIQDFQKKISLLFPKEKGIIIQMYLSRKKGYIVFGKEY